MALVYNVPIKAPMLDLACGVVWSKAVKLLGGGDFITQSYLITEDENKVSSRIYWVVSEDTNAQQTPRKTFVHSLAKTQEGSVIQRWGQKAGHLTKTSKPGVSSTATCSMQETRWAEINRLYHWDGYTSSYVPLNDKGKVEREWVAFVSILSGSGAGATVIRRLLWCPTNRYIQLKIHKGHSLPACLKEQNASIHFSLYRYQFKVFLFVHGAI